MNPATLILAKRPTSAGGSFPGTLAGLKVWYDTSNAASIISSGGLVSQVNDLSGNGQHANQPTGGLQSTIGTTTQNGRFVLVHSGTSWMFMGSKSYWKFLHDGTDCLIAGVWNPGVAGNISLFGNTPAGSLIPAFRLFAIATSTRMTTIVSNESVAGGVVSSAVNARIVFSAANLTTVLSDPDNATALSRNGTFLNAGISGSGNAATGVPSIADPSLNMMVGAHALTDTTAGSFIGAGGWWGELLIVSGADATEANRILLRDYLNTRWAVY